MIFTMESKNNKIIKLCSIIFAIILWQIVSLLIDSNILIASPIKVAIRLLTIWREPIFLSAVLFSLLRVTIGFVLGVFLGVIFGVLADRFMLVEHILWPYMVTIRSVPVASIVVICLIWLSASNISGFVALLIVMPVVYSNVLTGLKNRDEELEEVAKVYDISGLERVRRVLVPQIGGYLISSCSVTAGMAWKAGIAAEVIGTPAGSIGRQLYLAKTYLDTVDLFAWTIIIVVLSVLFEKLFIKLLKLALKLWCGIED